MVQFCILTIALGALALSVVYGVELAQAPTFTLRLDRSEGLRKVPGGDYWSTAWAIFYCGAFPVATTLSIIVDLVLFFTNRLSPLYAIVVSAIMFSGAATNAAVWFGCEYSSPLNYCYQTHLYPTPTSGSFYGISDGLQPSRLCFALLLTLGYFIYLGMALIAFLDQPSSSSSSRASPSVSSPPVPAKDGMKKIEASPTSTARSSPRARQGIRDEEVGLGLGLEGVDMERTGEVGSLKEMASGRAGMNEIERGTIGSFACVGLGVVIEDGEEGLWHVCREEEPGTGRQWTY
ncbi:hypothetical protein K402DRAFT_461413 [Aulographum hederae CBS 113979]|uniref:MARVEL domain-containing protein n=1 Tax=Aulographum hederae CBS 113979 TaxID=1176131 RepID=A0A6G1H702_9PEZI|nr:hypothetical protein K402DRAFT_461413 [Aulographum hederae CBS 113979]